MMSRNTGLAAAAIVVAFAIAVLVVDPRGNFPLDDDWDFAAITWHLADTGTFAYSPFTAAIVTLQAMWGAIWSLLFGQSFDVLRASTLFLSLASTLLFFALLRKIDVRTGLAAFASLAFLFHPLFFWSSFTFMTHVPAVFVDVVAALLFVNAVRNPTMARVVIAAVVATSCAFVRQTGAATVAAALIAVLLARREIGPHWKRLAITYGAGTLSIAVIAIATHGFMVTATGASSHLPRIGSSVREMMQWWVVGPAHYAFFNFQNAALFFAPLLLLVRRRLSIIATSAIAIVFGIVSWHMLSLHRPIPYFNRGNVFVNLGLGPHLLRDTADLLIPYPHGINYASRVVLMIVTTIGAIVAASLTVSALRDDHVILRFAALHCILGTALVSFTTIYFDRYSVDTVWPIALLFTAYAAPVRRWILAIALAVVAAFSITFTAEYLSWNRARWRAFALLQSHGVRLEQMDGGYEINAILALRAGRANLGKRGFGVIDDQFILAFNPVRGYSEIAAVRYPRLLGLAAGEVRVLRRND